MLSSSSILVLTSLLCTALAIAPLGTNDQVNAPIPYGSFANPSIFVRPRFRYWVPDASVNLSGIAYDIAEAGRVGAGGIELLGYYFYGDLPGDARESVVPDDWTIYGWGTPAWKEVFGYALQAIKSEGLLMDFAIGPNQGAGVPAPVDSEGLQWNLILANKSVPIGGNFSGALPGWGTGELVAATTALVLSSVYTDATEPSLPNDGITNRTQVTLASDSLQDVTSQVSASGEISLSFPSNATGLEYMLFAFYQEHTEYREQEPPGQIISSVPQSPVTSYVQNGSWVVDHFSLAGAQAVIDFWNTYLLDSDTAALLTEVGNYGWEDSQEFGTAVYITWTDQLPERFEANRGYSLSKYLPILFHSNNGFTGSQSATWYVTDESDGGETHVADYRATLLESNMLYLGALVNWTNSLGVQFSAQVGYNLPEDMPGIIPSVNAPECETLDFGSNIDSYRQFAGAANLAGKRIVSSECGAVYGEAYQLLLPQLSWQVKRNVAASVNAQVFHGFPFSGYYPNTTWPGFTTFKYEYSEMHGPHQPAWDFYDEFMNWTARTNWIAQSGVPKRDVAFWLKITDWTAHQIVTQYVSTDLEAAGYSYDYVSPDNLALIPEAYVENGILAPERQGYKALVVRANSSLTVDGVTKLAEYAKGGLPILFAGGVPSYFISYNASGAAYVNATMEAIMSANYNNVHVVPEDGLAATLQSIGITPRASVVANSTWNTYWRQDSATNTDYVYLYNDAVNDLIGTGQSSGNVTFEASGQPYIYDTWTGDITPQVTYQNSNGTITIPVDLAGNQTIVFGFSRTSPPHPVQIEHLPAGAWASASSSSSSVSVKIPCDAASHDFTLKNGSTYSFPPPEASYTPASLTNWTLIVETWNTTSNLYSFETQKTNSTWQLTALVPWNHISDSLVNVSGLGYYSTSFSWPPASNSRSIAPHGAVLDLGAIKHTAVATLNGHRLPPLDFNAARTDVGAYLRNGVNALDVVVSTPLGNGLRPLWGELMTSGNSAPAPGTLTPPSVAPPAVSEYGLVLPVWVRPYWSVEVGG